MGTGDHEGRERRGRLCMSPQILPRDFVTLVVGEAGTERYNYATPRSAAAQNYRQLFGKGVNARYVGFGLSDVTGQRFEMDTLGIEHYPLDRSI